MNILETERLILRPFRESDAESVYEQAKSPELGPNTGWAVHTSVENSRQIIRDILSAQGNYAVTIKGNDSAVGCIGIMIGAKSRLNLSENEAEIGYWLGESYWGRGYIPEAAEEIIRYCFEDLGMSTVWCGYFDGNEKSKRVNEKCGFKYKYNVIKDWPLINAVKKVHVTAITREEWKDK